MKTPLKIALILMPLFVAALYKIPAKDAEYMTPMPDISTGLTIAHEETK